MYLNKVHNKKIEKAAEIFKGFGNPIRIRIIDLLQGKSIRVKEISESLNYSQPIISQQLKILKGAGIVNRVKKKQSYLYELTDPHYSDMIKCMKGCLGI
ncbi:ArsR/SmtB family transcription factor [Candidatus Latescibacterota bacterium]